MTSPLQILLVTETLVTGGAETFVLRLARQLGALGHHVEVLNLNHDLQDPTLIAHFDDVRIHNLPMPFLRSIKRIDRVARYFGLGISVQRILSARWVERHMLGRFDVYHSHLVNADWLMVSLKRRHSEMRLISTLHGDYQLHEFPAPDQTERSRIPRWPARLKTLVQAINCWIYISEDQRALLADRYLVPSERLVRIYNGYEPPAPLPAAKPHSPEMPPAFAMVGRALPEKGWTMLIEAFGRLRGAGRLILVGRGPHLDELKVRHGLDSRIEFAGFHSNPAALLLNVQAFVFPSTYAAESLPTVIIEALYCGVPVIATQVGEIPAMLETPSGACAGQILPAITIMLCRHQLHHVSICQRGPDSIGACSGLAPIATGDKINTRQASANGIIANDI